MRVAQIAPLYESVPPKLYGGTERVIAHLSDALIRRGHDVVLFASGDSKTAAELVPCRKASLRLDPTLSWDVPAHLAMLAEVQKQAQRFDILHFHLDCFHLPLFADIAGRTVTTAHGRQDIDDLKALHRCYPERAMVSISESQRRQNPELNWIATIHHGYPTDQYTFSAEPRGGYLAFLGRIAPEKGVDHAIAIARSAGIPLRIAAKIDPADRAYFRGVIAPLMNGPGVEFIGEIGEKEKSQFLGGALALLFPISWPEPFGLVMIEAMACGTPIIAFNHGSVPEIVEHGRTGFVVDSVTQAVEAAKRFGEIDRDAVRGSFERRFSVDLMAQKYEEVYRALLEHEYRLMPELLPDAVLVSTRQGRAGFPPSRATEPRF